RATSTATASATPATTPLVTPASMRAAPPSSQYEKMLTSQFEKILTNEQREALGLSRLSADQKETVLRAMLELYAAGFNRGKEEGAKALIQSLTKTVPSGDVIESQIDGDFEGWEGETIVKLTNGQVWQQTDYYYEYTYDFMPEVLVYRSGFGYKMKVDGVDEA